MQNNLAIEFDAYYPHTKYAIYPQEATVEQLHPIFEMPLRNCGDIDAISQLT